MPYLIDGNNLIGAIPVIDLRDPNAREKLTRLLSRYQKKKGNSIVVVYDGPPPDGSPAELHLGRLRIIYAGPKSDADSRIKNFIVDSRSPDQWTVVSSDKRVYSYCKWAGAKAVHVMPFYEDIKKTLETTEEDLTTQDIPKEEIDDWLEYFGVEDIE